MAEDSGELRDPARETSRSAGSYLWYVPLTAIIIIDIILWRLAFIAPSPGRWISLVLALALIAPALPVAGRCPVDS